MLTATQEQKSKALKEFKLGDKSKFWNPETKRINARNFGATIGLSDYAINDWYARWKFDPLTDLSPLKTGKKDEFDALKEKYFEMLGVGDDPIYREAAAKIGATCSQLKRWRTEYKKNGGILKDKLVGRKVGYKVTSKNAAKPEAKSVQNAVKNYTVASKKHSIKSTEVAAKIDPPKPIQVFVEEKSDVETLDSFFDGLLKIQEENKALKVENAALKSENVTLKSENTLYKEKCQKWATRVVELQNGYALKG